MKHSEEEVMRLELQALALGDIIDQEIDAINVQPGMKILDAGCGSGAVTRKLALRAKPAKVTGVDFDPIFIESAKSIAADEGIDNVSYESGNIDDLKYPDESFDLTYCRLVLMHVQDSVKTVEELKRVTRKGGTVAISDQDDGALVVYPPLPKLTDVWNRYGQWASTENMDRYIGRKLFSILSQAGLKSIRIFPFPIYRTQEHGEQFRMFASIPVEIMNAKKTELMEQGVFTEEEYDIALEEFEEMVNDPGGFLMSILFLAVGEVP